MRIDRVKLAAEMARRDMSVKALAEAIGRSRPTISGIKNGRSCTEETGKAIAEALGVDVEEILEKVI